MEQENLSTEQMVLANLLTNEAFTRKALGIINPEHFEDTLHQSIFKCFKDYYTKWNRLPSKETLLVSIKEFANHNGIVDSCRIIPELFDIPPHDHLPALEHDTEAWCQDREMYLSIVKAISIYEGNDKSIPKTAIPDLMKKALAISLSPPLGTDLFDNAGEWFDETTSPEHKIPFGLNTLNDITLGGVTRKTLNLILAGVHVGKTMMLCHLATDYVRSRL